MPRRLNHIKWYVRREINDSQLRAASPLGRGTMESCHVPWRMRPEESVVRMAVLLKMEEEGGGRSCTADASSADGSPRTKAAAD